MREELEVARYALRTFRRFTRPGNPSLSMGMDFNWETWGSREDVLGPVGVNEPDAWADGTIQARCVKERPYFSRNGGIGSSVYSWGSIRPIWDPEPHIAPALDCTCGAYGSLSLNHLTRQYPVATHGIVAVIAAEGRTIIGTRGLRTQYARVVAYSSRESDILSAAQRQFKDAEEYKDVEQMVKDFGLPIEHQVEDKNDHTSMSEWWTGGE
jgi:hypothetical protein